MIFGLVTFAKFKLHPPSSIRRIVVHRAITCLFFVDEVDKLGGGMWLSGSNQLVLWVFYNEKHFGYMLYYLQPLKRHDTTNIDTKLGFH